MSDLDPNPPAEATEESAKPSTLIGIAEFIKQTARARTNDFIAEVTRLDAAVREEFPEPPRSYNTLFILKTLASYFRINNRVRRVRKLYPALMATLLEGYNFKKSPNRDTFLEWAKLVERSGFRTLDAAKLEAIYDELQALEEYQHLPPRVKAAPRKETYLIDKVRKIVTEDPRFQGWQSREVNYDVLLRLLSESGWRETTHEQARRAIEKMRSQAKKQPMVP